jgi:L-serine deaminase
MIGALNGKKTYVTAALGVIGAAAAMATGDITAVQGVQAIFECLFAAFIRHGIAS